MTHPPPTPNTSTLLRLGIPLWLPLITVSVVLLILFVFGLREQRQLQERRVAESLAVIEKNEQRIADAISDSLNQAEHSVLLAAHRIGIDLERGSNADSDRDLSHWLALYPDGSRRSDPKNFDASSDAAVLLPQDLAVKDPLIGTFGVIRHTISNFGLGSSGAVFTDTWFLARQGGFVIFWPDVPRYIIEADAQFEWRDTPWYQLATPANDPEQKARWTSLIFDPVAKQWQLSVVAPLYWHEDFLGSVGHDIPLDKLLGDTAPLANFEGSRFVLMTGDETVAASDLYAHTIQAGNGQLKLADLNDTALQQAAQQLRASNTTARHQRIDLAGTMVFASRIATQNWWLLHAVPIAPVQLPVQASFERLRNLALLTLGGELVTVIGMLWWNHRRSRLAVNDITVAQQALAENISILREVVQHSSDAVFVLDVGSDEQFRFIVWNSVAERYSNMSAEQVLGRTPQELFLPATAANVQANYLRCLHEGTEQRYQEHFGVYTDVIWSTILVPLRNKNGLVHRIAGFSRDVTNEHLQQMVTEKRKLELEQRVHERTLELEHAARELEAISYAVSHDLRAPLRHLDGFVNILRESLNIRLSTDDLRLLNRMDAAFARMTRLVEGLLAYLKTGRRELKEQAVSLYHLASEIAEQEQEGSTGPDVLWHISDLPTVIADPVLIRELFVQLLSNAISFTRTREQPEIWISATEQGEHIELQIRDNGIGFDMAHAETMFEVFQRLQGADHGRGPGVGLAIVRRIVQRHGGHIKADGESGLGACFSISLPLTRLVRTNAAEPSPDR